MNPLVRVLVLGTALSAWPMVLRAPAPLVALVSIAVGALAARTLDEENPALALAAGALAALAALALGPGAPSLAGGLFVLLAAAPRALRMRGHRALLAHAGGALGAALGAAYGSAPSAAVRAAALVVAGISASLAMLVPAEDPVAHALEGLATQLTGEVAANLTRAASLRRRHVDSEALEALSPETLGHIRAGWIALQHTAERRLALGVDSTAGVGILDRRIATYVEVLERIHTAAAEKLARTLGLDDPGLAAAKLEREGIEAEVRALTEIVDPPRAQA